MATMHLIRHGQASFGADDYDRLSELGWQQGRVLGRWYARHTRPDLIIGGGLRRHRETIEALNEGFGGALPEAQVNEGFNEFDHLAVIRAYRPEWAERQAMARDLANEPNPRKAFQKAFGEAIARWAGGQHDSDYPEPWPEFKARVRRGLDEAVDASAEAREVLVVTSGGPISVIAQQLLGLDDRRAMKLNEVLANASVTRMLYSGDRRSLAVFNSFAHLEGEDPALVTYR